MSLLPFGLLAIAVLFDLSDRRLPPWLGGKAANHTGSSHAVQGWRKARQSDIDEETYSTQGDFRSPLPSGRSPLGGRGSANGGHTRAAVTPRAAAEDRIGLAANLIAAGVDDTRGNHRLCLYRHWQCMRVSWTLPLQYQTKHPLFEMCV